MSSYLLSALDKFKSDRSVDYSLSVEDFICQCYVKLAPNTYGTSIQERLRQELDVTRVSASLGMGDFEFARKYFELKVSFLSSKTNSYCITHIRQWQRFNYYLLCFVDCEDNFRPNYYLLDKHVVHRMRLGYMNGTPDANSDNHNVELRITIKKDSEDMRIIKKFNLLKDTSLNSLKKYIKSLK